MRELTSVIRKGALLPCGMNTSSTIVSKGLSAGHWQDIYRGGVKSLEGAAGDRTYFQCGGLWLGGKCDVHCFPYTEVKSRAEKMGHEASRSKIGEDQVVC